MSAPQSSVYVCSGVRLNNRYEHSIYFANAGEQANYFANKVQRRIPANTYLRKSWPLKVEATMEEARRWSYLYFHNGDTGKLYYYFITNVEYKNDSTVELTLELDVLQTYMFDYELLPCFVERHHVKQDMLGKYTADEGLDLGELVDNEYYDCNLSDLCILTVATINPNVTEGDKPTQALGGMYGKVASGLGIWATSTSDMIEWHTKMDALNTAGFIEGIVSMWMYPKSLVELGGENTWTDGEVFKTVAGTKEIFLTVDDLNATVEVDGYYPNNFKLLTYPYNMLYLTNNAGQSATYRFERFADSTPRFTISGTPSPDGAVRIFPRQYNGSTATSNYSREGFDYGLTLGGFPQCAWDSDAYKLWLAQNQNQMAFQDTTAKITAGAGVAAGIASGLMGNVVGAAGAVATVVSGIRQIESQLAQKADMAIQPPQSRGAFSNTVNLTVNKQTFSFVRKSVSAETAKRIDNYFTMYGYKLNEIRTPNPAERDTYTYIKTVGCHIKSNMCTDDALRIESIFNNGITWWMNGDQIGMFSISDRQPIN